MIIDSNKLSKEQLQQKLDALKSNKAGNLKSFFGKLKTKIDALKLQKQLRNEWE